MSRETKGAMSLLRLPSGERFYLGKVWIERNINRRLWENKAYMCVFINQR